MRYFIVDGRLGKNAEVVTGKTGSKYVRFSLANTEYRNKEAMTTWFDVTCADSFVVEKLCPYLTKGKHVCVNGEFDVRDIVTVKNGKVYVNLRVKGNSISFISSGNGQSKEGNNTADKIEEFNPTAGLSPEPASAQSIYTPGLQKPSASVAQPAYAPNSPQPTPIEAQPVQTVPSVAEIDMGDDLPF